VLPLEMVPRRSQPYAFMSLVFIMGKGENIKLARCSRLSCHNEVV